MASGLRKRERFRLARFARVEEFIAAAESSLLEAEAANCLPLGLLAALSDRRITDAYLSVVSRGGEPLLVSMQTPPYRLILAPVEAAAAASEDDLLALFQPLLDDLPATLPGVLGPVEHAAAFTTAYCSRHGLTGRLAVSEQIYQCEQVTPPTGVSGTMRRATATDRELLIGWYAAFQLEAGLNQPHDATDAVTRDLADPNGGVWLWTDRGIPVSLAGSRGPTRNGMRVGPVFTPENMRGSGYASALVAALTQQLLSSGRRYVFLFTDLANAGANAIYQRLGYRAVATRSAYDFFD